VVGALRASLERLEMERVDLYQNSLAPARSCRLRPTRGLASAWQLGLTRAVGVSNYDKTQMQRAHKTLAKFKCSAASNQVEFFIIGSYRRKSGLLARCLELGVRLIAYSPLAMGLLTGKYTPEAPHLACALENMAIC